MMKAICLWQHRKKIITAKKPDSKRLKALICRIANFANLDIASNDILSVNFVGPRVMRRINREFLNHDYLTDVICFNYCHEPDFTSGDVAVEIFISPDIALERVSENSGLEYGSELLLYLVHAILHATGLGDKSTSEKAVMRKKEKEILSKLKKESLSFPFRKA
jgi:probable rRNA maturation factor